jgi:hypothetical protein
MVALLPLQCTPPHPTRHHSRHVTVTAGDHQRGNQANISDQLHVVVARAASSARLMIVLPGLETARGRQAGGLAMSIEGEVQAVGARQGLVAMGQDPVGLRVAVGCLYNSGHRSIEQ